MTQIILLNKPFHMMCQFSGDGSRSTLADVIETKRFPDFYPAGRLDYDSEGLLLLTNYGPLQHQIAHPSAKLEKCYWVQVEGNVDEDDLSPLRKGVELKEGPCMPAFVKKMAEPSSLWPREPPIRFRKNVPTSWLEIKISEGKNRQVRRMTAAIGFPTLRLIRMSIGSWQIGDLAPGEYRIETVNLPPPPKKRRSRKRK